MLHQRILDAPHGATGANGTAQIPITASYVAPLRTLVEQIRALDKEIDAQLAAHADAHIFTGLPNSGRVRAARLLAEIGDCRARFRTPESLTCLADAAPSTRQSGKSRIVGFRWACDKQLRDAVTDFAADTRLVNPSAADLYTSARAAATTPRRPHPGPSLAPARRDGELEEVEQLANHVEVLVAGGHAASGDYREIRRFMMDRTHQYAISSSNDRALAAALMADRSTAGVSLGGETLRIEATEFLHFAEVLPRVARDAGVRLYEVTPVDESLETVFSYLAQSGGARPLNRTIIRLTARAIPGGQRAWLLAALGQVLVAIAVVVRLVVGDVEPGTVAAVQTTAFGTFLPLFGLIVGTGVIGPEIDGGSIVHLLANPVSRHTIVQSKLVLALLANLAFAVLPTVIGATVLGVGVQGVLAFGVGALCAGAVYSVLFTLLSIITRHAVIIGLVYALVWESLVGSVVPGAGDVSVPQWAQSVTSAIAPDGLVTANVGLTLA